MSSGRQGPQLMGKALIAGRERLRSGPTARISEFPGDSGE
jgi:hypothetical protein